MFTCTFQSWIKKDKLNVQYREKGRVDTYAPSAFTSLLRSARYIMA